MTTEAKQVALYARCSTTRKGQDPEVQLRELRAYCERRGWTIAEEFVDRGVSGKKERRPALDRLMKDARRRRFDAVVVWKFDRFARSTRHLVTALEEFQALDVDFVSLTEALDTSTPMGRAMFAICGAMAQLEADLIKERVLAGLDNARANGKTLGRPRARFDLAAARDRLEKGESLRAVAQSFDVSHATLSRHLAATAK
jgi:DNA invertase Pin-like site-specific DNA recombinase